MERLNVNDALGAPQARLVLDDSKLCHGGTLNLDGWGMPLSRYGLSQCAGGEAMPVDRHVERAENEPARCHLEYESIEPIEKQEVRIWGLTPDLHRLAQPYSGRIRDHGRHCQRDLLEGGSLRRPKSANSDVGTVRKMLPPLSPRSLLGGRRGGIFGAIGHVDTPRTRTRGLQPNGT